MRSWQFVAVEYINHPLTRIIGRRLTSDREAQGLNLLFFEKRQSMGDALVRISRGNVVRVAADHYES